MDEDARDVEATLREAAARGLGLSTAPVLAGTEPIRLVMHNGDGTWDFLCNTTEDPDMIQTVHVREMFDRFAADLTEVRDLPRGWLAERREPGDAWLYEEIEGP
jgi:hypothetical protein